MISAIASILAALVYGSFTLDGRVKCLGFVGLMLLVLSSSGYAPGAYPWPISTLHGLVLAVIFWVIAYYRSPIVTLVAVVLTIGPSTLVGFAILNDALPNVGKEAFLFGLVQIGSIAGVISCLVLMFSEAIGARQASLASDRPEMPKAS